MSATERSAQSVFRWARVLFLALLLLGFAAHVAFWYLPRIHPAEPLPGGAAATLLASPAYDVAIWLPYPHQNLAALEKATGDLGELAGSIARLSGASPPTLPRFGPFRIPPAREMAWASSADGRHWQAVVRLYPSIALLLRAAGRVAGNPWLAGGVVQSGTGHLRVRWRGSTWFVTSDTEPAVQTALRPSRATADGERAASGPSLGAVRLARARGLLPAGTYRIRRTDGTLEITMGRPPRNALRAAAELDVRGAALAALHRESTGSAPAVQVLAVLSPGPGSSLRLPSAVLLWRGGLDDWRLPGEARLRRLGVHPLERRIGQWTVRGWDDTAIQFGRGLIPRVPGWEQGVGEGTTLLELDVAAVGRWAAAVGGGLRHLPLAGKDIARPWLDTARLAAACGPRARILAAVDPATPGVVIRLSPAGEDRLGIDRQGPDPIP